MPSPGESRQWLLKWWHGDQEVLDKLRFLVYDAPHWQTESPCARSVPSTCGHERSSCANLSPV